MDDTTRRIIGQVASALHALHTAGPANEGVTHAGVCPENILVDSDQNAYLTDLGLASRGSSGANSSPALGGNLNYQGPQTVRGLRKDRFSDIFQLGVVLYEMLTLVNPFLGVTDFDTLETYRKLDIPDITHWRPDLDAELLKVVRRALQKAPTDRFETAERFAQALRGHTG